MESDSIARFSRTVEHYRKHRPTYPQTIVEFLEGACRLPRTATIADIGSGTGRLSEIFLKAGYRVLGVEPNRDMRLACQEMLHRYSGFTGVAAVAEETTLEHQSVDLIVAGQAYHWFDQYRARKEFGRILRPEGWVALVWNIVRQDTPFLQAFDQFLRTYRSATLRSSGIGARAFDDEFAAWYAPGRVRVKSFDSAQVVDYEGLKGCVLSYSFIPAPGSCEYDAMLKHLETVFREHQERGLVTIHYDCRMRYGQLS